MVIWRKMTESVKSVVFGKGKIGKALLCPVWKFGL